MSGAGGGRVLPSSPSFFSHISCHSQYQRRNRDKIIINIVAKARVPFV